MNFKNAFDSKTVLVTGHTGFKGAWLTAWLEQLGANVVGISVDIPTIPSHFLGARLNEVIEDLRLDIRDGSGLRKTIEDLQPDYVFHLAAQSLVRQSYENPLQTWQTNVMGTINLLEALRGVKKKCVAVIITSDKCYDNVEWVWGYRETDALGGSDPYSASKGMAELAVRSYAESYFTKEASEIRIASARAGNVIGGGDWANDRIIPDCIRSWADNRSVELRNPRATRPWQHVLEPLSGYLNLACDLSMSDRLHGEAFNFGPHQQQNYSVLHLVKEMALHWKKVQWEDISEKDAGPYESRLLKLNCDKALHYLGWRAAMSFEETVFFTAEWYRSYYDGYSNIHDVTKAQITAYSSMAKERSVEWAEWG